MSNFLRRVDVGAPLFQYPLTRQAPIHLGQFNAWVDTLPGSGEIASNLLALHGMVQRRTRGHPLL